MLTEVGVESQEAAAPHAPLPKGRATFGRRCRALRVSGQGQGWIRSGSARSAIPTARKARPRCGRQEWRSTGGAGFVFSSQAAWPVEARKRETARPKCALTHTIVRADAPASACRPLRATSRNPSIAAVVPAPRRQTRQTETGGRPDRSAAARSCHRRETMAGR